MTTLLKITAHLLRTHVDINKDQLEALESTVLLNRRV